MDWLRDGLENAFLMAWEVWWALVLGFAISAITMALAALAVDALFSVAGLVPDTRPTRDDVFGSIEVDYKLFLNLIGTAVFLTLFVIARRAPSHHHHHHH